MPFADFSAGLLTRREFMRASAAGGLMLGAAGSLALLTGCERQAALAQGYRVLRPQDLPLLAKLLPAVLEGVMPVEPAARATAMQQTIASFDQLLWDTSPAVRGLFTQLLDLLNLGVARALMLGLWTSWEKASDADAAEILERLGNSRVGFLRGIYNGIVSMTLMSWYFEPAHQAVSGYPGPPKKVVIDDSTSPSATQQVPAA